TSCAVPGAWCRVLRVPWVSPFFMGNKTGCVNAITRVSQRVCFRGGSECSALGASTNRFAPKRSSARRGRCRAEARPLQCPNKVGANRPAGTREALPGTICGTCVPRFKRMGTIYRAPTKKKYCRANYWLVQKDRYG